MFVELSENQATLEFSPYKDAFIGGSDHPMFANEAKAGLDSEDTCSTQFGDSSFDAESLLME